MTNQTVIVEPAASATISIIALHGLGSNGEDLASLSTEISLPTHTFRWICPTAPVQPITLNQGYPMTAWFDLLSIDRSSREDQAGIEKSAAAIHALIDQEVARGISTSRIFILGFSQGAALGLYAGLSYTQPIGGIIALSGYLPLLQHYPYAQLAQQKMVPIFCAHGTRDDIVPLSLGENSQRFLKTAGYLVSWHTYLMAHSINKQELNDIQNWISEHLV